MAWFKRKKNQDQTDLSIVDDYKEPFYWRNFWDDHIVERYRKIHDFLKEHGILYFFMSPFQYKNRLILKLVLILLGVTIGVVPRTISLIDQAKFRNNESEIANAQETSTGAITVQALASGQHDKQHVLALNIIGDTNSGVPSNTAGFSVKLSANRGVSDGQHVKYRYKVLPIDTSDRLLVVYVDNRKQEDTTGIYNLDVHMKGHEAMSTPIEIVLSNSQKTTALFAGGTIHLDALSDALTSLNSSDTTTIKSAQHDLDHQVRIYQLNESRLNASGMTIGMTTAKLKAFIQKYSALPTITDQSTTADLAGLNSDSPTVPDIVSSITAKGKTYKDTDTNDDDDDNDNGDGSDSVTVPARDTELPQLSEMVENIESALSTLNTARLNKYTALDNLKTLLNRPLTIDQMTPATVLGH